jgi:hypothetical protein
MADVACLGSPDGPLVTPGDFVRLATPEYKNKKIFPYCRVCHEILEVYGINSPGGPSRFDHQNQPPDADPLDDCVLARRNRRFRGMEPDDLDADYGKILRNCFFEPDNLKIAYAFCLRMCRKDNLPAAKFRSMVDRADRRRIWAYANIPLWVVPYILLTLENFTALNSKGGEYGFHFIFDKPRDTSASSLWLQSSQCKISKIFSDRGILVKSNDNPYPLSEHAFLEKAGDTSWISVKLLQALMV